MFSFLKKYFSLIVLSIFFFLNTEAQQYNFTHYGLEEGLSQSQVYCIIEDKGGFLWIGTEGGGISRFDGIEFKSYTTYDGLIDNQVRVLFEDKNEDIWVGTKDKGICLFDKDSFIVFDTGSGFNAKIASSFVQDASGSIFIGTRDNGLYVTQNKSSFNSISGKILTDQLSINSLKLNIDRGELWIGTHKSGLIVYNIKTKEEKQYKIEEGLPSNNVTDIVFDLDRDITWLATSRGLVNIENREVKQVFDKSSGLVSNELTGLLIDKFDNLWIRTEGEGICKFDGVFFTCFNEQNGLGNNYIISMMMDRTGGIWFGSDGSGIFKFNGDRFVHYSSKDGLSSDIVMSIFQDSENNKWFGTYGGGVCLYKKDKTFECYNKSKGLCADLIYTIMEDNSGAMWFGSKGNGVSVLKSGQITNYLPGNTTVGKYVYDIEKDKNGNIWIGSYDKGISVYTGDKFVLLSETEGLQSNQVFDIYSDEANNIWIATNNKGVIKIPSTYIEEVLTTGLINKSKTLHLTEKTGLCSNRTLSIIQDSEKNMWFGTFGGGVDRYDGTKFENYSVISGLNSNYVYLLIEDTRGLIWVGTEKGLNRIGFTYKTKEPFFKTYSKSEGFTGIETNINAAMVDNENKLWFGTIKGATRYEPNVDLPNVTETKIHITDVKLYYDDIDWKKYATGNDNRFKLPENLVLPYEKNNLTFKFIGIDLVSPEKVYYQWYLDGFDEKWTPKTKQKSTTYSNLPPGEYTFLLKSSNSEGIWNKEPVTYKFTIKPPYYLTWWFILIVLGVLGALIYLVIKLRERKAKREKFMLKQMVEIRSHQLVREKKMVEQQKEEIQQRNEEIKSQAEYLRDLNSELEKLSVVAGETSNSVLIVDKYLNVEWVNKAFEELYEYSFDEISEIIGDPFYKLSSQPDIEAIVNSCIENSKSATYTSKYTTQKGNVIWLQTALTPIYDDNNEFMKLVAIESDITAIKEAEEEIKHQKEEIESHKEELEATNIELEKLSIVAGETSNSVIIANEQGVIEWVNKGFTRLYGYTLEEYITEFGANILKGTSDSNTLDAIIECMESKNSVSFSAQTINKENQKIWIQSTITPIVDDNNNISRLIIIGSDITHIKKAQAELSKKNLQIMDSINYAYRIQSAVLPSEQVISSYFADSFIYYKARDIISGDFPWFFEKENVLYLATIDCTGHGVPGALLSLVGYFILNNIVNTHEDISPGEILNLLHLNVKKALKQEKKGPNARDGMDVALCKINKETTTIEFGGAFRPLYLIKDNELLEIKGDRRAVGGIPFRNKKEKDFTTKAVECSKGDKLLLFSDGIVDQLGGPENKKFQSKKMKLLFEEYKDKKLEEFKNALNKSFMEWKGNEEQTDDIIVLGVEL